MFLRMILIAAAGALPGIVVWLALHRRRGTGRLPERNLLAAAVAVGLGCRLAFALGTPTFYAPDEQAHFQYVRYLAEQRALPVQTSRMNDPGHDWEYYQPPLYYLALTPVYAIAEGLFHQRAVTVRALRLVSILLWGVVLVFSLRFLDALGVSDGLVRATVIGMVCLVPTYVFLSSAVNNDNLLIALGSAILWRIARPASLGNSLWLGGLAGLALLGKLTAVAYLVLFALVGLAGIARRPRAVRGAAHALLATSLALLIGAPWLWRNQVVYGSLTAENVANIPQHWASAAQAVLGTLAYMQDSFWAVSGVYNNVSFFYPSLGRHLAYLAGVGLLLGVVLRRDLLRRTLPADRPLGLALALALAANAVLVFRFGILYGQGQGRFLYPLLVPGALVVGTGLRMFTLAEREDAPLHLTGFLATYALSFTAYSLAMFPRGAAPWGPPG